MLRMALDNYRAIYVVLARYCYRKLSVRLSICPSVCDVVVPWACVGFFETNYMNN